MDNAKNQLYEFARELGYFEACITFESTRLFLEEGFHTRATFLVRDGREIIGEGTGQRKTTSQIDASTQLLNILFEKHKDLIIDWEQIRIEAQAGDGLIKLCAYLNNEHSTAAKKSFWLQEMETDKHMVEIFDRLHAQNDSSVALFGDNLGAKRKATWIEALIARRFGSSIISPSAGKAFEELIHFLQQ
ncbi:MAG: hypothetical protein ACPG49_11940 [Chitinophagales bacterium]